jgi:hypothetical protein
MYAIYMVTFTINIPQMCAYIPYMDPMGYERLVLNPAIIRAIIVDKKSPYPSFSERNLLRSPISALAKPEGIQSLTKSWNAGLGKAGLHLAIFHGI